MRGFRNHLLLAALPALAPELMASWVRVGTTQFEVCTNAGERTARRALENLEEMRAAFPKTWTSPLPVRVVVFAREAEYRRVSPGATASAFYQSGPERDYIVGHAEGAEFARSLRHEYVHAFLQHSSSRIPPWLEEGLAEFYSTYRRQGREGSVGSVIESHVRTLSAASLSAKQLMAWARGVEPQDVGLHYAQSWALVRMLLLWPPWRDGFTAFWQSLENGTPQRVAFRESFGRTMEEAIDESRGPFALRLADLAVRPDEEPRVGERPIAAMAPGEAGWLVAELHFLRGLEREALALLQDLERAKARGVSWPFVRGLVAMRRGEKEHALQLLQQAAEEAPADAAIQFEYAMLLRESRTATAQVREGLMRTVKANPDHPEARFLLGVSYADQGRHEEALEHLERAARVLPRQSYFWHALALSYREIGRRDDARRAAMLARDLARDENQRKMAEAAVALTEQDVQTGGVRRGAQVITPKSWERPRGERQASGVLTLVECLDQGLRFHITRDDGKELVLTAPDPGRLRSARGSSGPREFACGPQEKQRVTVEFGADLVLVAIDYL
ncbi:MAG: tetratricopeptide repeat protein [Bryobacteraceae bacterium]|nr:tetratricopeptide repeat protein [Bryobacteraceae bacterium]